MPLYSIAAERFCAFSPGLVSNRLSHSASHGLMTLLECAAFETENFGTETSGCSLAW